MREVGTNKRVKIKVKVKVNLQQTTKAQRRSGGIALLSLSLNKALEGVVAQHRAPAALPPRKTRSL
jgi:hypothetical protein